MCGGPGTRLGMGEKPLVEVDGEKMIDQVMNALQIEVVDDVYAAVSPHTPQTRKHVDTQVIDTSGDGYVPDLRIALRDLTPPVITVATDLPLLSREEVNRVMKDHKEGSLSVVVPRELKEELGLSIQYETKFVPSGFNVVGKEYRRHTDSRKDNGELGESWNRDSVECEVVVSRAAGFVVNVNTRNDLEIARDLA